MSLSLPSPDIVASNQTKKIDLLDKVISSLETADYSLSNAMSHALVMRADAYLDFGVNNPKQALADATKAIEINHLHGRAFRVKADAHEALDDVLGAMEAVENWALVNPAFKAKARKELSRLSTSNP